MSKQYPFDESLKQLKEIDAKRSELIGIIKSQLNEYQSTLDFESDEEGVLEDEFRDLVYDLGRQLAMTSNLNYKYDDWTPGEPVEFWVPSTC